MISFCSNLLSKKEKKVFVLIWWRTMKFIYNETWPFPPCSYSWIAFVCFDFGPHCVYSVGFEGGSSFIQGEVICLIYVLLFQQQQCNLGPGSFPVPPSQYNPLEEPSPLGLRLKKSPSLLDLIQMTLSQGNFPKGGSQAKKEHKATTSSGIDKLKASNFPASFLRIGTWEVKLRLLFLL